MMEKGIFEGIESLQLSYAEVMCNAVTKGIHYPYCTKIFLIGGL